MPLIKIQSSANTTGQTAEIYRQIQQAFGRVPNALQLHSASPIHLEQVWQNISYYMKHSNLSFSLLATISMLVSQENQCDYCIGFNAATLIERAGYSADQIIAIKADPNNAPLSVKEKAMLLFVLKSTSVPQTVTADDIEQLRVLGWCDADIFDGAAHGARNMAVDALFNTFKIENDF